jgi:hypothetical protein
MLKVEQKRSLFGVLSEKALSACKTPIIYIYIYILLPAGRCHFRVPFQVLCVERKSSFIDTKFALSLVWAMKSLSIRENANAEAVYYFMA